MPVMPRRGKVIMCICSAVLLMITGTLLVAAIYKNESLTALLTMTEMRIFIAITGAMCILLPILIFGKWYAGVRSFKKLLAEADEEKDDIYQHLSDSEQAGGTDRLNSTQPEPGTSGNETALHRLVQFTQKGLKELKIDRLPYTIGKKRGVCDGIIESDAVSRIHARVIFEGGTYYMTDLNSTNGTIVNGSRLKPGERQRLRINDEISFGRDLYYFR